MLENFDSDSDKFDNDESQNKVLALQEKIEEEKARLFFSHFMKDHKTLKIPVFNEEQKLHYNIEIKSDYPLYFVLKLVYVLNEKSALVEFVSSKIIDKIHDLTSDRLKQPTQWTIDRQNLTLFIHCMDILDAFSMSLLEIENRNKILFRNKILLTELIAWLAFVLKKNTKVVSSKKIFTRSVDTVGSDMLISLGILYFEANQFNLSESYCLKHLAHLETLPNYNVNDINKRKMMANCLLGRIYLKRGEPEVAVNFLKTVYDVLDRYYYKESINVFPGLFQLYKELMYHFRSDSLKLLNLRSSFLKIQELINKKAAALVLSQQENLSLKQEASEAMNKDIKFINAVLSQAKEKYPKQFQENIAKSTILNNTVGEFNFNFDKDSLTLKFKNIPPTFLKQAFKAKNVTYTARQFDYFSVSINECGSSQLERVCQYASSLHHKDVTYQAEQLRVTEALAQSSLTKPIVSKTQIIPTVKSVSQPETAPTQPELSPRKPSQLKPTTKATQGKGKHPPAQKAKNKPASTQPKIRYEWSCGMVYDSTEPHTCQVKHLKSLYLPDNLWFGYIPDWLKTDEHYNAEFEDKLNRGIKDNCVRHIAKELQNKAPNNDCAKHPYKFKIVVRNHNYRVYGWIEETFTDEEGKNHYLVCFGFLADHKLCTLPDADTIRKRHPTHSAIEQKVREEEQAIKKELADTFMECFAELVYGKNIPEELKKPFVRVLEGLYNDHYSECFSEEAFTVEQAKTFFSSLHSVCDQIILLNKTEPYSKQQLEIIQNITQLLSNLGEENGTHQLLIPPLLNTIKRYQQDVLGLLEVNQVTAQTDGSQVISEEDERAQKLIEDFDQLSEKLIHNVNVFKKILTTPEKDDQKLTSALTQKTEPNISKNQEKEEIPHQPESNIRLHI